MVHPFRERCHGPSCTSAVTTGAEDTRCTDCYRLGTDGLWVLHPFESGQTVKLASVALDITAAQLFAEI